MEKLGSKIIQTLPNFGEDFILNLDTVGNYQRVLLHKCSCKSRKGGGALEGSYPDLGGKVR